MQSSSKPQTSFGPVSIVSGRLMIHVALLSSNGVNLRAVDFASEAAVIVRATIIVRNFYPYRLLPTLVDKNTNLNRIINPWDPTTPDMVLKSIQAMKWLCLQLGYLLSIVFDRDIKIIPTSAKSRSPVAWEKSSKCQANLRGPINSARNYQSIGFPTRKLPHLSFLKRIIMTILMSHEQARSEEGTIQTS